MKGLPDKPLKPAKGEIACREWEDSDGARHVLIVAALRPHSFVQRHKGGRGSGHTKTAGTRYNAWRKTTQEQLAAALRIARIGPFPASRWLGVVIAGGMTPTVGQRGAFGCDAIDLTKAVEDVFTDLLYKNDRPNRVHQSYWIDDKSDWFSLAAWGEGQLPKSPAYGRVRLQADWMADEAWVGPTNAEWLR